MRELQLMDSPSMMLMPRRPNADCRMSARWPREIHQTGVRDLQRECKGKILSRCQKPQ